MWVKAEIAEAVRIIEVWNARLAARRGVLFAGTPAQMKRRS